MLYAQHFNAGKLTIDGEPHAIGNVQIYADGRAAMYSATENELVFQPTGSEERTQIVHVDHAGKPIAIIAPAAFYFSPRLSPDGKRFATDMSDTNGNGDIWIWEVDRPNGSRFTFDPANESMPVWSPDAKHLAFIYGLETSSVVEKPLGGGELRPLVKQLTWQVTSDWSPDGRTLLIEGSDHAGGNADLFAYTFADQKLTKIVGSAGFDGAGRFSPDGRWFAYVSSNENGRYDVFVEPFPQNGSKWQVSTGGGFAPVWGRDGKSLYFVAEGGQLTETAVSTQNGFTTQTPRPLFGVRLRESAIDVAQYDVAPDGSFIVNAIPDNANSPMTLVVNWREALAH
jgi:Tol biopolymer transport system component